MSSAVSLSSSSPFPSPPPPLLLFCFLIGDDICCRPNRGRERALIDDGRRGDGGGGTEALWQSSSSISPIPPLDEAFIKCMAPSGLTECTIDRGPSSLSADDPRPLPMPSQEPS